MKHVVKLVVLIVASTLACGPRALAQQEVLEATVPFDFAVGNRVIPSGTYRISPSGTDRVNFVNTARGVSLIAVGDRPFRTLEGAGKLVFDEVGNRYFLRAIVAKNFEQSLTMPVSKLEKRILSLPPSPPDNTTKAQTGSPEAGMLR